MNVVELTCLRCGRSYRPEDADMVCEDCGSEGLLDVGYDHDGIARACDRDKLTRVTDRTMWLYESFLPVSPGGPRPGLHVGGTPLYRTRHLGEAIGLAALWVKDEGLNPTSSLKDRASAVAVARALEDGRTTLACASTGNAASSLAGNAANVGLRSVIFVPERAPAGKVTQLLVYGAAVISVKGTYEDAFALSQMAIGRHGWYNRNAAINPYLVEGKKTVSLELAEQMGWEAPDWVAVSVGDGCTIAGVYKGFDDLVRVGWLDRGPRLLGVQAEGCAPIFRSFTTGRLEPSPEATLADSIAVGRPRNPEKALRAVRASRGMMITVSDEEILEAMRLLGRTTGVFGEPAGVASLAGLKKAAAAGLVGRDERAVVIMTGNGLKDIASGARAVAPPVCIPPDPGALEEALRQAGLAGS